MSPELHHLPDAVFDEQRRSWLAGERRDAEYFLRESGHEVDPESLLDLLYHEILLKEELGISSSVDEYSDRYPELADELALHFEVHRAVRQRTLFETIAPHSDDSFPHRSSDNNPISFPMEEYEIRHLIGRGAMASVYQARHRRLHREVALKVFQTKRSLSSQEISRIQIEAAAMARLTHPNIIQIFEIGDMNGSPFLALELASGGTLAERLSTSPMTADSAAELIETLSNAVQHAHDRNVIHRDLKPANILFSESDIPKVTDFGLAKVLEERDVEAAEMTRTGEAIGTPRYMSPEQAAGAHHLVCPATDVYALGTILYECLTGHAPFISPSVSETLYLIREMDPLPLRKQQPSVPRDLETICLHCLNKDPAFRYSTARELADDLHRFREKEPIHVRPASVFERIAKWSRKHPGSAAFILLTSFLLIFTALSAMTASHREHVRLDELRRDVVRLMKAGQMAVERDELEEAQSHFRQAWQLVQAEPRLADHITSVTGWLDHTRNALNRYHWKQRIPPRDFDHRRDEALLLSLLAFSDIEHPITSARQAIQDALDLTLRNDIAWKQEREQLVLVDAELVARETGADAALAILSMTDEFDSFAYHCARSHLLEVLGKADESHAARAIAEQHPVKPALTQFAAIMTLIRDGHFAEALPVLDAILERDPEHFGARLMQAVCFLKLNRAPEAIVGLTACIAQRPNFQWNYVLRGWARQATGQPELARSDFQSALAGHPSQIVKSTVLKQSVFNDSRIGSPTVPSHSDLPSSR